MEEFEGVMFDEGDFEVVDECTGEEDPVVTEPNTQADDSSADNPVIVAEKSKNADSTADEDFSVDISMDTSMNISAEKQDESKEAKVDDPDVIFIEAKSTETKDEGENADNSTETNSVVEVIPPEHAWYEEKLQAKKAIVNERLSKLARVLELSYPTYKPWLEHSETPVCHLDPPRRCPLDRPHTNRWKFICSRKPVQDSTSKDEDSAEGTVDKKLETVWRLGPTDGSGVNTDNASQYPPFVMRVVKVFEEFIQNVDETLEDASAEEEVSDDPEKSADGESKEEKSAEEKASVTKETAKVEDNTSNEAIKVNDENEKTTTSNDDNVSNSDERNPGSISHNWLWLLVRSNSKDELMVFATGKKISDATMQKLKQTFESGPGMDCNVKSLYCKSIYGKNGNTATSNITFLLGTEALDETVGGVKIQLAPKTNFWSNASGVEQLGAAVGDMLKPLQKSNLIEVGCGLGLISLMLAPNAKQVIGLDAPSEVEEAEMTCELNKIKNASFVTGTTSELMEKVTKLLKNTRASAIINGNTKLGRDIEVMTALRKIPSLRRVVMITTLTKQSVRAILELTRPVDGDLGNPFMPLRAILVDTLPTGPHFEVVIRMERLNMNKMEEPWFWHHVKFRAGLLSELPRKNPPETKPKTASVQAKKTGVKDSPSGGSSKNTARANNRSYRRNRMRKQRAATRGIVLGTVTGVVRTPPANLVKNPLAASNRSARGSKRPHSPDKPTGNAKKPATKGIDSPASPDPSKPVKVAKSSKASTPSNLKKNPLAKPQNGPRQRLSGAQKRNRRHWAQLEAARSGGNQSGSQEKRMRGNQGDLRGRLSDQPRMAPHIMQKLHEQQMLMNMSQQRFGGQQGPMVDVDAAKQLHNMLKIVMDETNKLQNLPRSVWDRIAPPDNYSGQNMQQDPMMYRDRFVHDIGPQDIVVTAANRNFSQVNSVPSLFDRPMIDRSKVMPAGMTSLETRGNNSRGSNDRGGRDNRKGNDWNRGYDKNRGNLDNIDKPLMSIIDQPILRPLSPKRPLLTPPRNNSPSRRFAPSYAHQQEIRRQLSPPRRQQSPPRRHVSPPRNPHSEIFQRRPVNRQPQQQMQQQQNNSDTARRGLSPISRREQTSNRALSPPRRFPDDWDMQSGGRGSMQSANWNQRGSQMQQQRSNDRNDGLFMRKQSDGKEGMWMSGGGDLWNSKQSMGQQWSGGNGGQGPSGGNYGQSSQRGNWRDKGDKEDWSDLPENARDPWGDDNDKMDQNWGNKSGGNNWQKGSSTPASLMSKQIWPNMNNQNSNEPQRWMPQNNDSSKSMSSGNWQSGNNYGMNNWRPGNFSSFSQQRQGGFGSNNFKDGR